MGIRVLGAGVAAAAFAVLLPVVALVTAVGALGAHASIPSPVAVEDIPAAVLAAYQAAALTCPGLSWTVLAGIGKVESDHGRSDAPGVHAGANPAGAEGPMQFLPATFLAYEPRPGASPYDMGDATLAAARMLCANGASDPAHLDQAIWAYNHSQAYVDDVLAWAARYAAASSHAGDVAAAWALTQVGKPYQWGAAGPDAFDCSGLSLRAWEAAGVELPRVAADQYQAGTHIPVEAVQPGDLVFFDDPIGHVGIALGGGMMVDAPHTGALVRVEPIYPDGLVPLATRPQTGV